MKLAKWRRTGIVLAFLSGAGLVALDARDVFRIYHRYLSGQLGLMYTNHGSLKLTQDLTNRWANTSLEWETVRYQTNGRVYRWPLQRQGAEWKRGKVEEFDLDGELEMDFTLASYIPANRRSGGVEGSGKGAVLSPIRNSVFNLLIYDQEIVLAALALLVLFQVVIHCVFFWFLDKLGGFGEEGLTISLDPYSPLHEFGLESWNHVLNNIYWIFSGALLIPIFSRRAQLGTHLDVGQWILQVAVPVLIAAPMLLAILGRQRLLPDVGRRVTTDVSNKFDEEKIEMFHAQRLWPLDKNWVSKLGIVLAFALLSYMLGVNLLNLAAGGSGH